MSTPISIRGRAIFSSMKLKLVSSSCLSARWSIRQVIVSSSPSDLTWNWGQSVSLVILSSTHLVHYSDRHDQRIPRKCWLSNHDWVKSSPTSAPTRERFFQLEWISRTQADVLDQSSILCCTLRTHIGRQPPENTNTMISSKLSLCLLWLVTSPGNRHLNNWRLIEYLK